MLQRVVPVVLFFLLASVPAFANGWAAGQNFVPVVRDTTVSDEAGNRLALRRGMPVHVKFNGDEIETSVRWDERPFERRISMDMSALPAELEGFMWYQRDDFNRCHRLLTREAAEETDPLVKTWKLILAGHSGVPSNVALDHYRHALRTPRNPFQLHARYFVFRALRSQGDYAEARKALIALGRELEHSEFEYSVLFSTYPRHSVTTAWSEQAHGLQDIPAAIEALDDLTDAKAVFEARHELHTEEARAEAVYALAVASERLWNLFPDKFFDSPHSLEVIRLLELTFEGHPETEAAAKALEHYQRYLDSAC